MFLFCWKAFDSFRYATTIRDSKRAREHAFLKRIHECVEKGGKVLIPVFALGRAQELCILIDSYPFINFPSSLALFSPFPISSSFTEELDIGNKWD